MCLAYASCHFTLDLGCEILSGIIMTLRPGCGILECEPHYDVVGGDGGAGPLLEKESGGGSTAVRH